MKFILPEFKKVLAENNVEVSDEKALKKSLV